MAARREGKRKLEWKGFGLSASTCQSPFSPWMSPRHRPSLAFSYSRSSITLLGNHQRRLYGHSSLGLQHGAAMDAVVIRIFWEGGYGMTMLSGSAM